MKIVALDGIIGAGKTSLLKRLKEYFSARGYKIAVVHEPIERWQQCGIFQKFCKEPKKYAYEFQTFVHITRLEEYEKVIEMNPEADLVFMERSCYTDKYIFVELLYDQGLIDDMHLKMYNSWWGFWAKKLAKEPDGFIYIKPSLEECMRRVEIRGRDGEKDKVSKDYQLQLADKHDKFFRSNDRVLVIETDENFIEDDTVLEKIAKLVIQKFDL